MNIENKVALITGGASGLGLATAKNLHEKGAKLVLMDLNEDNLNNAKEELKDNVITVVTNVADEDSVKMQFKQQLMSLAQFTFLLIAQVSEAHQRQWEGMEHIL